jgi:NADH:ubiquinone oxidoreductase subunit C
MPFSANWKWIVLRIHQYFLKTIPAALKDIFVRGYDSSLTLSRRNFIPVFCFFKKHSLSQFKQLVDIAVYDRPGKRYRFTVLYHLLSIHYGNRITCLVQTDELTDLPSTTSLYSGAGWQEREVWDLFGIFFTNHLDLRRILTDYGFSGFPLRKDFPLSGFLEVFYSDEQKRVIYQPVELSQEFRNFNYSSPWET